ncbi:MAG: hypothetical protein PVI89_03380 [Desulfobacteraceae bacterium]|jgi:hypothetical protein
MEASGLFCVIGQQGVHLFQKRRVAEMGLVGQRLFEFRQAVEEIADAGIRTNSYPAGTGNLKAPSFPCPDT